MISGFCGHYQFLSNFYPCRIELDGAVYGSVEHAFQAAKTFDVRERLKIAAAATPKEAKRLGRRVKLRDDWERVKLGIMAGLLRKKFSISPLKEWLLATGDEALAERNDWNDTFWGVCNNVGTNYLGKLLMQTRDCLRQLEK